MYILPSNQAEKLLPFRNIRFYWCYPEGLNRWDPEALRAGFSKGRINLPSDKTITKPSWSPAAFFPPHFRPLVSHALSILSVSWTCFIATNIRRFGYLYVSFTPKMPGARQCHFTRICAYIPPTPAKAGLAAVIGEKYHLGMGLMKRDHSALS